MKIPTTFTTGTSQLPQLSKPYPFNITPAAPKPESELETLRRENKRLTAKVCDIVRLVHDRFHCVGQFREADKEVQP